MAGRIDLRPDSVSTQRLAGVEHVAIADVVGDVQRRDEERQVRQHDERSDRRVERRRHHQRERGRDERRHDGAQRRTRRSRSARPAASSPARREGSRASAVAARASWNTTSAGAHHSAIIVGNAQSAPNSIASCTRVDAERRPAHARRGRRIVVGGRRGAVQHVEQLPAVDQRRRAERDRDADDEHDAERQQRARDWRRKPRSSMPHRRLAAALLRPRGGEEADARAPA